MLEMFLLSMFPLAMILAATSDLLTMTIPNRVVMLLAVSFLGLALWTGMPLADVAAHLVVGFGVLAVVFVMFSRGWVGGGDAKLFAATALWFGWDPLLMQYAMLTALVGGAVTGVILLARLVPLPGTILETEWVARLYAPTAGVPYGVALAIAGLVVYSDSFWFAAAI